jgi:hypothetical protein
MTVNTSSGPSFHKLNDSSALHHAANGADSAGISSFPSPASLTIPPMGKIDTIQTATLLQSPHNLLQSPTTAYVHQGFSDVDEQILGSPKFRVFDPLQIESSEKVSAWVADGSTKRHSSGYATDSEGDDDWQVSLSYDVYAGR